jgi:hypothetical protein
MAVGLVINFLSLVGAHIPPSSWAHDLSAVVASDAVGS